MQHLWGDLRYAARQLKKSPGFTITAVLTLALGVGATTAIFSCVNGLLLQSLPFHDADRIVAIGETNAKVPEGFEATYLDYQDWRRQQQSFTQVAAYADRNPDTVSLVVDGHAEQVHRVLASGNFFSTLGVSALNGRLLDQQDDQLGHDNVAVLSASAWQRLFGSNPDIIGRSITLNGAAYTVIGVLPQGAVYPAEGEVWLPLSLLDKPTQQSRVWHSVNVIGRLRPGVSLAQAQADMQTIASRLAATYAATNRNEGVLLKPMRDRLVGALRPAMLCLLGAVALMLLVACANVANLLLVRATENSREVAIRRALGADRKRLVMQFMAQAVLLCMLGGLLGTTLAAGALPLLRTALAHTNGLDPSMIGSIRLSSPVLFFTLAVCMLTAIVFGLLPATKHSPDLTQALRAGDRGSSSGIHSGKRAALIAAEIAVAVVVVFLGALVIRSFARLASVDPGFRTDHLLSAEITLPDPRYTDSSPNTTQFFQQVIDRLSHSPGVASVGTTTQVPMRPSQVMTRFLIEGAAPLAPGTYPYAQIRYVSTDFFHTMGLALRQGRIFNQSEVANGDNVFIVNEAFARRYLADRNPLGSKILIGVLSPQPSKIPVIGVVANAHDLGVDTDPMPEMYLPGFGVHEVLLVRSTVDPATMTATVRDTVRSIDANQPIYHVETIGDVLSDSVARQRMTATLLGIFGLATLTLAAIGIYGVLSYSVAQRTREIGVRIALGANRRHVLLLVLRHAGLFTAVGLLAGIAAALASARIVSAMGLLFQTSSADMLSIAAAIGALVLVAAIAVIVPATRAAAVDPMVALRAE